MTFTQAIPALTGVDHIRNDGLQLTGNIRTRQLLKGAEIQPIGDVRGQGRPEVIDGYLFVGQDGAEKIIMYGGDAGHGSSGYS